MLPCSHPFPPTFTFLHFVREKWPFFSGLRRTPQVISVVWVYLYRVVRSYLGVLGPLRSPSYLRRTGGRGAGLGVHMARLTRLAATAVILWPVNVVRRWLLVENIGNQLKLFISLWFRSILSPSRCFLTDFHESLFFYELRLTMCALVVTLCPPFVRLLVCVTLQFNYLYSCNYPCV